MESEYRSFLAASILSEDQLVTYRLLSRALNVHVNVAKEMLFEFHRQENGKKPGTVYATYLVAGVRHQQTTLASNRTSQKDGEDDYMQSSPFRSSPPHHVLDEFEDCPTLSITLVGEDNLEELQSIYEVITSIHIYSLALYLLKDLQVLSDAQRQIAELQVKQDRLQSVFPYGAITNVFARRRQVSSTIAPSAPAHETFLGQSTDSKSKLRDLSENNKSSVGRNSLLAKAELKLSQSSSDLPNKGQGEKKVISDNPPQLKRGSSSIFKAFAKAKPKLERKGTDSSAGISGVDSATYSGPEDETMKDTSEDDEEMYVPPSQTSAKELGVVDRKGRIEREAALRKMMDDDDQDIQRGETLESMDAQSSVTEPTETQPTEEAIQVTNGRRRGRRRVMKKKTIKDEEGYLVTKEEPAWESFSEDESIKAKAKASSSYPSSSEKVKTGSGKPGQGNIMSFFQKK